jgi:hypothetical protein
VAGVTLVFGLSRFNLVPAGFYKVSVRSSFIAAGSDQQQRKPMPAARERQASLVGRLSVRSPGTLAGRPHCLWPTQVIIPTTLAPETVKVAWVQHGALVGSFLPKFICIHRSPKDSCPAGGLLGSKL